MEDNKVEEEVATVVKHIILKTLRPSLSRFCQSGQWGPDSMVITLSILLMDRPDINVRSKVRA